MKDKSILIATTNKGKMNDIREIFKSANIKILSFSDFENYPLIEETGSSFEENALLKAKSAYEYFRMPVISDDSGLAVAQLNDAPGVYSARYAGINASDEDNNRKLVAELKKYPEPHLAKYICIAVYYDGYKIENRYGECSGRIIKQPRGVNGFGYDPHFVPDGYNLTMAEMNIQVKNKISHRWKAFEQLIETVEKL
ncbi:MAG: RdgB/HAM1 family non-canonical purine NTP pyrophosphatase [Ignavibacteriaceae bacterium]